MEDNQGKNQGSEHGVWIAGRNLKVGETGEIKSDTTVKIFSEKSHIDGKVSTRKSAIIQGSKWTEPAVIVAVVIGILTIAATWLW